MVLPSARKTVSGPPHVRRAIWMSSRISSRGLTRYFFILYMPQKAHLLWGQPMVAWIIRLPASHGGRKTGSSYLMGPPPPCS